MRLKVSWLLGLLSVTASAGPRTLVLGGGNCEDPELAVHVRAFGQKLQPRLDGGMLELDSVAERLRPPARASADEVRRQVEAAQAQFYASEFRKAETVLEEALKDAASLPPGADRVKLQTDGWLLQMLLAREQRQQPAKLAAMNRVLRLRPDFKLDPVFFPASVRQEFDAQRGKLKTTPSAELVVKSSPSGAEVSLDGVLVGRTPFRRSLPQGTYFLQVVKEKLSSFARSVDLRGAVQSQVDLDFEGSVETKLIPCLAEANPDTLMNKAVRLGSLVDTEQVVVLTVQRPEAGPSWVTASLISVERGQKTREAGFKARGELQTERALSELAEFVATGQATKNVVVATESGEVAPWTPPPVAVAARSPGLELPRSGPRRWVLWGGLGAGAGGLLGAGILRLVAQGEMDELTARSTASGFVVEGDARGTTLRESLQLKGGVITGLLVVGGAGVAAAAGALFWPRAEEPLEVTVLPTPWGSSVQVVGSF
ncbi:MAG: PEGA domain-containing protein [Myxococcota bacterium]|nr:PEGA domain-containing protein [Myxococcota bacterium]